MLNIKALITTLAIVGTSSAVMAHPITTFTSNGYVIHERLQRRRFQPIVVERPMFTNNNRLAPDASAYYGTYPILDTSSTPGYRTWGAITEPTRIDRGRQFISDLPDLGRFDMLRLKNVAGTSHVTQVYIQFQNDQEQVVKLDTCLERGNPTIDIDLTGSARQIKRVIVYGSSDRGAAYQLLAR